MNPNSPATTFKSTISSSRLDYFWISPDLVKNVHETKIDNFNSEISDHAGISIIFQWKHKALPSLKYEKTWWNNRKQSEISNFSQLANLFCEKNLDANIELNSKRFKKIYGKIVTKFKRISKKLF